MKTILFAVILSVSLIHAQAYLSQESIDSTVQGAFYGFVEASRSVGIVGSQRAAITRAQETVAELKRIAVKDPNRRYILWRVSELEQQIFLEQEEVNLQNEYQRVTEINRLVALFNEELFIARPNFAKLHTLQQYVDAISAKHGNQFVDNINQKNKVVTQNLQNDVEAAFARGDYASVEEIYMYAVRNRKYLNVNMKYYEQWSGRIQAKKNADFLKDNIGRQMTYLRDIVTKNKIAEARRNIDVISSDIESASRHLASAFVQETNRNLSSMRLTITAREDSLVQVAKNLAAARKAEQASYYMDRVLRPAGVNPDKISMIDREILSHSSIRTVDNKEVNAEIDNISANTNKTNLSASEFNAQLRVSGDSLKRHYAEMDSKARSHFVRANQAEFDRLQREDVIAEEGRAKADAILEKVKLLVEQGKSNNADKLMIKNETTLLFNSTPDLYIDARRSMNRALGRDSFGDTQIATMSVRQKEMSVERQEEKCVEITTNIYMSLEKRDILAAAGLFYRNESLLRKHSYADAFQTLKKQIVKEYSRKYMK